MKDSGPKLLRKFKEMNSNPEDNKNNIDRELYLTKYSSQFEDLTEKAERIVKDNNYNIVEIFGNILCYLNFHLNFHKLNSFITVINDLSSKNNDDVFTILFTHNTHFINQKKNLNNFIDLWGAY